jgi:hypothetical protein
MAATTPKTAKATGRQNAVAFKVFSNDSSVESTKATPAAQPLSIDRGHA